MQSELIRRYFAELAFLSRRLPVDQVAAVIDALLIAHGRDSTIFVIGNGGSAATASHFANDLFKYGRSPEGGTLRVHALTDSVPIMTAVANDISYDRVFADQLAAYARPGDVLVALSGSGNSRNIVQCLEVARSMGVLTVGLAGFDGGALAQMADIAVRVPGSRIQVIEDVHAAICHAIALGVAASFGLSDIAPLQLRRPAIFCDRDGVLNVRRPDHVKSTEEFEFAPGALVALCELGRIGAPVVVITNQSVIGRGLATADEVERIHAQMQSAVVAAGGPPLAIYVCPHSPEKSCECRKPRPGLLLRAAAELGLDLQRSVFIGDSVSDVFAALSAGCHPILIGPPSDLDGIPAEMVTRAMSLTEAATIVAARPEFARSSTSSGLVAPSRLRA